MMEMYKKLQVETANVVFVYDNVLKSPDPFIIKSIKTKYRENFEDFLDFSLIDTMANDDALSFATLHRKIKNPLEWLAKKEFDYEKFYTKMKKKFKQLYIESPELYQYKTLKTYSRSYCIDKIYIWNPYYDVRQHADLQDILESNNNIQYVVSENFVDCLDDIGDVNLVYDWDIDRVKTIIDGGNHNHIYFGVAAYPFNLENDELKYELSKHDNVGSFPVVKKPTKDIFFG